MIKQTFPEDVERALAIAKCESGFNPNAKGPTQDSGIFQLHEPSHGKRMEKLGLDPFDVEDNVAFARMLYDEQGWKPWVCAWSKEHLALVER